MAAPLRAQGFLEQFSYEGVRFAGIGIDAGAVISNSLTTEPIGGVRIDLGLFAPRVRVMLGGSYFRGQFDAEQIAEFETRLQELLVDCTCSLDVGSVTMANVEVFADLQYLLRSVGRVQPYVALGISAHVRDGDGAAIDGTFVEDALDTVAAGVGAAVGLDVAILSRLAFVAEVRGGLTSELRTVSARGGFMLRFP